MEQHPALIVHADGRTRVISPNATAVLGRDDSADIRILDDRISRRHLRLEPQPTGWVAIDTSTNGIYVAGNRFNTVPIRDGLVLHLGDPHGIPVTFEYSHAESTTHAPINLAAQPPDPSHEPDEDSSDFDIDAEEEDTDPVIAQVGATVAARRNELELTLRSLARDGVIAGGSLVALEKGRRWPRNKTLGKLEDALQWPNGYLNHLRADATEALSNSIPAPLVADVVDIALAAVTTELANLPEPTDPQFAPQAAATLERLRKLESAVGAAARTAKGCPPIALALAAVRARYHDLMIRAAASPNATLGQRLYASRRAIGLSTEEAANAAGVSEQILADAEADAQIDPTTYAALDSLIAHIAASSS